VQALAAVAVTIEQRRQMLGAYQYATAVPGSAGSFEAEIDGPCCGSSAIDAGNRFSASGALYMVWRREGCGHGNLL
jgi:hypothetical protein